MVCVWTTFWTRIHVQIMIVIHIVMQALLFLQCQDEGWRARSIRGTGSQDITDTRIVYK